MAGAARPLAGRQPPLRVRPGLGTFRRRAARDDCLPTVARNCRLRWAPRLHRWLLPAELAVAAGVSARPELAAAVGA
eukprot:15450968-Alexandrium_andersonii.AAC.1